MGTDRLFVYGSLKRGGKHHDLMAGARFLGEAATAPGFTLVALTFAEGQYWALVPEPGSAGVVPGELFEVPSELFRVLDDLEGNEYEKCPVPVREKSGETRFALAYVKKPG